MNFGSRNCTFSCQEIAVSKISGFHQQVIRSSFACMVNFSYDKNEGRYSRLDLHSKNYVIITASFRIDVRGGMYITYSKIIGMPLRRSFRF